MEGCAWFFHSFFVFPVAISRDGERGNFCAIWRFFKLDVGSYITNENNFIEVWHFDENIKK